MKAISRRELLVSAIATGLLAAAPRALAHSNAGVVSPALAPPALSLTLDDGKPASLQRLLHGHVSAVQLMFTSCRATCPIQGAVFAEGARLLGDRVKNAQWLSVSIDPTRDDPKALRSWLERFGAHPRWRAARPDPKQIDAFVDFLKARNQGPDRHTAQVYYFDARGSLVLRSVDFPPASEIASMLEKLAKKA